MGLFRRGVRTLRRGKCARMLVCETSASPDRGIDVVVAGLKQRA